MWGSYYKKVEYYQLKEHITQKGIIKYFIKFNFDNLLQIFCNKCHNIFTMIAT